MTTIENVNDMKYEYYVMKDGKQCFPANSEKDAIATAKYYNCIASDDSSKFVPYVRKVYIGEWEKIDVPDSIEISKDDFEVVKEALLDAWMHRKNQMSNLEGKEIPDELHNSWRKEFVKWFDLYNKLNSIKTSEGK